MISYIIKDTVIVTIKYDYKGLPTNETQYWVIDLWNYIISIIKP